MKKKYTIEEVRKSLDARGLELRTNVGAVFPDSKTEAMVIISCRNITTDVEGNKTYHSPINTLLFRNFDHMIETLEDLNVITSEQ